MPLTKNTIRLKVDQAYAEQPVSEDTGAIIKLIQAADTDIQVLVKDGGALADITSLTGATLTLGTSAAPETAVVTKAIASFTTGATEDQFDSGSSQHFTVSLSASDLTITEGTYYMRLIATDGSTIVQLSAGALLVLDKETGLDVAASDPVLYIPKSLLTARGDVITRGASDTSRLALGSNGQVLSSDGTDLVWSSAGAGDVTGPASSVDNTLVRFDSTTGKILQAGSTSEDDSGNVTVSGNIVVTGTVDGRDVATDGTKLDGIESAATADQSNAEIKTAYEANADTNEFSDAEQTKLSGIETAADVTDETNVVSSLDGATLTDVTVATGDKVIVQDASDSDNVKTVTAQSIADLGGGGGGAMTLIATSTIAADTAAVSFSGANLTGYDVFMVVMSNIEFDAVEDYMAIRMSTDGGTTMLATLDSASYQMTGNASSGSSTMQVLNNSTIVSMGNHGAFYTEGTQTSATDATASFNGTLRFYGVDSTARQTTVLGHTHYMAESGYLNSHLISGTAPTATRVDYIEILPSRAVAKMDSGVIRLYGINNS